MSAFKLTRSHVIEAFAPLQETADMARRNAFFSDSVVPDVKWTVAGQAHSLIGTQNSMKEHADATFNKIGKRLDGPIKFVVTKVIVDGDKADDGWWTSVELKGEATRRTGMDYNNEYVWLTRFNDQGKIVEIRSYFDTLLSEMVLAEPAD
ncbi:hypothetical protein B0J13DRAFT_523697 [Dactylonectria estremocensis]|uniref:SnoaL-like domain-containing protein n=1 Tax=Dactylonectria estremocensis TaxID=1079267 RepID=A0A9P9F0M6_9HYPO|nr:hypothetical protein B0J13DRAFT_523697 [Dactylonectria estremocensis]